MDGVDEDDDDVLSWICGVLYTRLTAVGIETQYLSIFSAP